MVITIYVSGISGNKEVKKRQQRVLMILDSRGVQYEVIDIAEPGRQAERDRLKTCGATPPGLPPQLFNGDEYCGDYDQFDLANEIDELDTFLKEEISDTSNLKKVSNTEVSVENGLSNSHENTPEKVKEEESTKPLDSEVDVNSAFIRSEGNIIEESKNSEEKPTQENAVDESENSGNADKEVDEEEEEEENESENDEE